MSNSYDSSLYPSNWTGFQIVSGPGAGLGGTLFSGPSSIPSAPSLPQITGSSLAQGIQGTTVSIPGSGSQSVPDTSVANPTAQAPVNAASAAASAPAIASGSLADYFARAIIVILGFIFVAIGLRQLGVN